MLFVIDQHPVGALGWCGAFHLSAGSSRVGSAAGSSRLHAFAGEDLVERGGELGVAVADEEAEAAGSFSEVHEEIAACWTDEQHRRLREDRVHMEEIAGQQAPRDGLTWPHSISRQRRQVVGADAEDGKPATSEAGR